MLTKSLERKGSGQQASKNNWDFSSLREIHFLWKMKSQLKLWTMIFFALLIFIFSVVKIKLTQYIASCILTCLWIYNNNTSWKYSGSHVCVCTLEAHFFSKNKNAKWMYLRTLWEVCTIARYFNYTHKFVK